MINLFVTATLRPDTYYAYTYHPVAVETAREEARKLFTPELYQGTIPADDPVNKITVHFFATPASRSGGFVAYVSVEPVAASDPDDPNDPYQNFWRATKTLSMIYDITIEPYAQNLDNPEARFRGMFRTPSWDG